jgi:hypothetical protein
MRLVSWPLPFVGPSLFLCFVVVGAQQCLGLEIDLGGGKLSTWRVRSSTGDLDVSTPRGQNDPSLQTY